MIFALDIGTRKVAGILGEIKNGKTVVVDAVVKEHEKRAMLDGQIHKIDEVSKIVNEIKAELEQRNSVKLYSVHTALAGRNLHTEITEAEVPKKGEVTAEDIALLELECVKKGYAEINAKKKNDYYCVGYSPVYYKMDGDIIKNPVQQNAVENLVARSIVTFLPKIVFDSMITVLRNCGLHLEGMTLEPIAALYVTIPEDMRLLNLALVDVGAGTSDIAVTDKGRIVAYGMIPMAGDEITEEVCREFLVDFHKGEGIKRGISEETGFESKDIFNNTVKISYDDFKKAVYEKTDEISKKIADEILVLNTKQPQAVVMVGGGSGLTLLKKKIAEKLSLPESRVGSRLPDDIVTLENPPEELSGTEGITPLGILETALHEKQIGFIDVFVNGEKTYIINLNQEIRAIDVLVSSGMELKTLYGKPGGALTYTVNGDMKILRGTQGKHARIYINNEEKTLYDGVKKGDRIFVTGTQNGSDASAQIRNVVPADSFLTVSLNGKSETFEPDITLNGKQVSADEPLIDRAVISVKKVSTAAEIITKSGFSTDATNERDIMLTVNNEPVMLKQRNYQLKVNGIEVSPDFTVKNMDRIEFRDKPSFYRIKDILKTSQRRKITVTINGKPFEMESENYEILMNGRRVTEDEFIINGADIKIINSEEKLVLSSIFRTYPIDTQRVKGKILELYVDGTKAGYTTPITEGSSIEIKFV